MKTIRRLVMTEPRPPKRDDAQPAPSPPVSKGGTPLTDDLIEELAAEAEAGYDLSKARSVDRVSLIEQLSRRASSSGSPAVGVVTGAPALDAGGVPVGDEQQKRNY